MQLGAQKATPRLEPFPASHVAEQILCIKIAALASRHGGVLCACGSPPVPALGNVGLLHQTIQTIQTARTRPHPLEVLLRGGLAGLVDLDVVVYIASILLGHSLGLVDKVCCQGRTHVNPTKCQYMV